MLRKVKSAASKLVIFFALPILIGAGVFIWEGVQAHSNAWKELRAPYFSSDEMELYVLKQNQLGVSAEQAKKDIVQKVMAKGESRLSEFRVSQRFADYTVACGLVSFALAAGTVIGCIVMYRTMRSIRKRS